MHAGCTAVCDVVHRPCHNVATRVLLCFAAASRCSVEVDCSFALSLLSSSEQNSTLSRPVMQYGIARQQTLFFVVGFPSSEANVERLVIRGRWPRRWISTASEDCVEREQPLKGRPGRSHNGGGGNPGRGQREYSMLDFHLSRVAFDQRRHFRPCEKLRDRFLSHTQDQYCRTDPGLVLH